MLYYLIAGEASGDLHGSNLMMEIIALDLDARFRFWGGDKMAQVSGQEPVKHISQLAFMGFKEVVVNLKTILNNISMCKQDILRHKPDVLVLIDYPGFNLRIARFAKEKGIKVVYYIAPQVWAWKQSRVKVIERNVDQLLVILPFETEFFARFGVKSKFVGHPLLDAIENFKKGDSKNGKTHSDLTKPIVAILPGSRKQEIASSLPVMVKAAKKFPDIQFLVAGLSLIGMEFYKRLLQKQDISPNIEVAMDQTYQLLAHSKAAMVTSGTATLEASLLDVPQVVCYRGGRISYLIAKRLIKIRVISLVNLVAGRKVVQELIQDQFNSETLAKELNLILSHEPYRQKILDGYKEVKTLLGRIGASKKAAAGVVELARCCEY